MKKYLLSLLLALCVIIPSFAQTIHQQDAVYNRLGVKDGYFNLSATIGSSGYGIRSNSGTVETKNSGGSWTALPALPISLTSGVTGTLPIANGGTNKTSYTQYGILYAPTISSLGQVTEVATANKVLLSALGAAPVFSSWTLASPGSSGTILKSDGTNWAASDTLSVSSVDLGSGTLILPKGTSSAPTASGSVYYNTTSKSFTIGDGATANVVGAGSSQNFITNSGGKGFVMSNGTLANQGSNKVVNGTFDSDTGWIKEHASITISGGKAHFTSTTDGYKFYQDQTYEVGKLYAVTYTVSGYTGGGVRVAPFAGAAIGTTRTANGTYTDVVVCLTASSYIGFQAVGTTTLDIDDVTLYEVEPSIAAASGLAMDKWNKANSATGVVLTRKFNGGLLDEIEMVSGAGYDYVAWSDGSRYNKPEFYKQFAGRTVSFGAWVKTSTASKARLSIYTWGGSGSGAHYSAYHTGSGAYEWIEVSLAVDSAITGIEFDIYGGLSNTTYFKNPMGAFTSYIGSGNYVPIAQERIVLETKVHSQKFYPSATYSKASATLNYHSDSYGVLPKNIKEIGINLIVKDSGSATASCGFGRVMSGQYVTDISCSGIANNVNVYGLSRLHSSGDGTAGYATYATGSNTMTVVYGEYDSVQF